MWLAWTQEQDNSQNTERIINKAVNYVIKNVDTDASVSKVVGCIRNSQFPTYDEGNDGMIILKYIYLAIVADERHAESVAISKFVRYRFCVLLQQIHF